MKKIAGLSIVFLVLGIGINLIDAYFSGNLPFSPENSDQNNKLSVLNRLGKTPTDSKIQLGTMLAIVGAIGFAYKTFKRK